MSVADLFEVPAPSGRDYRLDAAPRPQPKRGGTDVWPTPTTLINALIQHVLPSLPDGPIWECACCDGRLEGAAYALLPSKAQLRSDGTVIWRDDGRVSYTPLLKFSSRDAQDRFSKGVVELVRRRFPEALL